MTPEQPHKLSKEEYEKQRGALLATCPVCGRRDSGHDPGCLLAAALSEESQ